MGRKIEIVLSWGEWYVKRYIDGEEKT